MDFLVAIGTGIVGKISEFTVAPVIRQVGYVIYYNKNLKKLESQVDDLGHAAESMKHAVETEKRKGREIEAGVLNWLTKVDEMTKEANDFLKDEQHAETRCLLGFCPNLKLRHHRSRKSTKLVQEVAELCGKKDFGDIAYDVKPEEVYSRPTKDYQAFDSRTSVAKKIMNELRQSNTDIIGVYGIGGVGKTTLAKEVYRQATEGKTLFDDVVIVLDVKKIPDFEEIQKRIAEKLGMEFLGDETIDKRAGRLCHRIKDKKVLVILDDIQEKVDLEILGLPRVSNCKVLLTSRTREVLSVEMRTQKEFQLDLLNAEENWSLFEKMAGDVVQNSAIREVATEVAQKCGGLPVLVVTVASALKNRSALYAWKDALRRLKTFDKQGFTEKAYLALEWSYEQLDDEELKPLFLLSGNMRGYSIYLLDLLKYSMGLGLIKNVDTMEEAQDALLSLVEKLKDSCLLLEDSDDNKLVRMHDLVHEVVNRIASRDQYVFKVSIGDEFKEWPTKDFCKKSTMIVVKGCSIPHLPEGLECPELKLFTFSSKDADHYLEIPSNFFEGMKKLKVLDLTGFNIPSLPPSLQFLESLRTLCLDQCTFGDLALVGELRNLEILSFIGSKFRKLPKEIGQLTRLRLLDLNGCSQLEVISPNVISNLKRLENLRMGDSFNRWEGEGVISSERRNANLEELKHLPQLTALQIHIPDANILPADFFTTSKLKRFQICIGSAWQWDNVDEALNALKLRLNASNELDQGLRMLLKRTEDLYLEGTEGVNNSIVYQMGAKGFQKLKHLHLQTNAEFTNIVNGKVRYPNLTWLAVNELNGLTFLLSSSMARSLAQLKRLQVSGCQIMEEIVSIEESDEEIVDNFFCQLQILELKDLPNLTKFCSRNHIELSNPSSGIQHFLFDNKVEFPNLKKLSIDGLAKLTTIWNNQFSLESSKNLETIEIVSCDSLNSIFPASVARSLQQLRSLKVQNCGVEEIISKEDGVQTTPMFVFPKLTYVRFRDLPQLRSFYPGLHSSKWPSLVVLVVQGCTKVQIFAEGRSELNNLCTPNKQSLFLLVKDSFPNLELLGLCVMENWDSPPLHLFGKLESLYSHAHTNSSLNSLEKLLGLENVKVSSQGEIHAVGDETLPHLRKLHLSGMREMRNLGEDSFGPACPYFPHLEILKLEDCDSLKNLRSSPISFKNLTTLQVSRCKGLKYLISFSMAKSLMQLTKLEVQDCEEMIEIVGSNENDDSENEIEFRVLKHLELSALPSLRGFSSATRIVKFPSLEKLSMSCTQLETFIFDSMGKSNTIGKDIKDTDSSENHETEVVQPFLFDKKVEFPRLKSLFLKDVRRMTTIWHGQLSLNSFSSLKDLKVHECGNLINIFASSTMGRLNALETLLIEECKSVQVVFEHGGIDVIEEQDTSAVTRSKSFDCRNLKSVEINSCENLRNIFPASVAKNLQQLERLIVRSCGTEEIIANEGEPQRTPTFVFPNVTYVYLTDLPQLRCFYPAMHTSNWPALQTLVVVGCYKLEIFSGALSSFQGKCESNQLSAPIKQTLFSIEKDSFPNLEDLTLCSMEIWNGPFPVHFFRKLKSLTVCCPQSKSVVLLGKLLDEGNSRTRTRERDDAVEIGTLPHSRELYLYGMQKLVNLGEDSFGPAWPFFPNLEILKLEDCDSLKNLRSSPISFKNLTTLQVSRCKGLKYLISFSMAKSLMQLTKLEVQDCEEMIEIVGSNENDDSENEIEFRVLKHLELSALPSLRGFCSATRIVKFPSLEKLSMSCAQLETFIFDSMGKSNTIGKDIKDTDSSDNHETEVVQPFLFDNKVEFPRLKSLFLKDVRRMTTIWHGQLSLNSFSSLKDLEVHECGNLINIFASSTMGRLNALETLLIEECKLVQVVFELGGIDVIEEQDTSAVTWSKSFDCRNLKSVKINSCESLRNIFPASVARNLQQLERLIVRCCGVEEIIANEGEPQTTPKFVFSKVRYVSFIILPQLRSLYPAMHVSSWPALRRLLVGGCHKLEIFSGALSSFQGNYESNPSTPIKQTLFSIEKDSFPNLEDLTLCSMEIWNGPLPVHFFRKLKSLTVCCPQSKSVVFLDKLLDEGSSSTRQREDAVEIGTLPHLRKLELNLMPNLMHLGEDNSQSAPRPNFPNLEILLLNYCDSLRNLRSSAISFKNLTTLEVSFCKGLKYLLTYSVARGLKHLTKLEVEDCKRLVSIVGSTEEDDSGNNDEITFRRLKHLRLSCLPRLQGFCSGNCIAEFPSLETLTMSNRLKLKIFPAHDQTPQLTNEENDTDVDYCEWRVETGDRRLTVEDELMK